MPPKRKRGPPYEDDPGCKYLVIEDPWPGNATGKERGKPFYNDLSAWVHFMLDKQHEAECIFAVNARNEVIVQLSQDVDIVPILGAHPWPKFLYRGAGHEDVNRVSYVFAYDYRKKGDPAKHNWLGVYPDAFGDQSPHLEFPVKFPYPHVSWASPKNKNCVDIALPLPPVRQPTPIPDTSAFTPYQHPSQLTSGTIRNAEARREDERRAEQRQQSQGPPINKLGQIDPDDEDKHALQSLRNSSATDVKPRIKTESHNASVKQEQGSYGPSNTFKSAIEELQQTRRMNVQGPSELPHDHSARNGEVKPKREELPSRPSDTFVAAIHDIRRGHWAEPSDERMSEALSAKPDPDMPPPPSDRFVAAFNSLRGIHDGSARPPLQAPPDDVTVKQEARTLARPAPTSADDRHANVKFESGARQPAQQNSVTLDPRRVKHEPPRSKRVKGEEDLTDGPPKRFKSENYH